MQRQQLLTVTACLLFAVATSSISQGKNPASTQWAGWRNQGNGHFAAARPPTKWSTDQQIRWKTKMPGPTLSSPVAAGDCVITTAEPVELICLSLADGTIQWQRSHRYEDVFPAEKAQQIAERLEQAQKLQEQIAALQERLQKLQQANPKAAETPEGQDIERQSKELQQQYDELTDYPPIAQDGTGNSTSTPVSDGKNVWAVFATGIVSSHTVDGKRNWMQFIENPAGRQTASPLLVDGMLIVHLKNLIALDTESGEVLWKADTPPRSGTPIAVQTDQANLIVTPAGAVVRASDGKVLAEDLFSLAYCSPVAHADVVYAVQKGKTKAIRLRASGDQIQSDVLWEQRGADEERCASPLFHDGLLYSVTTNGILDVQDAATGDRVYRQRLDFGDGRCDPSLVLAGSAIYISNNNGTTLVIEPGREFKEVTRNTLEGFSSSMFLAGGNVLIRTNQDLYCISD